MCLQDIKLAKQYEVRGRNVLTSLLTTDLTIGQAGNRRMIRFVYPVGIDLANPPQVTICWLPAGTPIPLGFLFTTRYWMELDFKTHGEIVYGPFNLTDIGGGGLSIGVSELLANQNEELVA